MFYGWRLVGALSCVYFLSIGAALYGLAVAIPEIIAATGWTRSQVGLSISISSLSLGLAGPLIAFSINRITARWTMVIGGGVVVVGSGINYLSSGLYTFYVGVAVLSVGMAMQTVIPGSQVITNWFSRRRGMAIGIFMASSGLGAFVAAPAFAFVIDAAGDWNIIWPIIGGAGILSSLLALFMVRDRPSDIGEHVDGVAPADESEGSAQQTTAANRVFRSTESWTVKEALKTRTFWIIVIGASTAVFGLMVVNSQAVLHMQDLGLTKVAAAAALGITGLLQIAGRLSSGILADRFEPRYMMAAGLVLELISVIMLIYADNTVMAYAFAGMFGLGYGLAAVSSPSLLANNFGPASYAPLFATRGLLVTVVGAAGPVLVGRAYDVSQSYTTSFMGYSIVAALVAILVLTMRPPLKPKQPTSQET